ncbi:MAG: component of SufBCD complex [Rhodobacteraceae bacterium]|nr:component of SufBCD complex [Paracoccaceae bacterium]
MEWYDLIFVLIDLRSFSNLWYWIAIAVLWSSASHWVLGVPFDLINQARRKGGAAADDMTALAHINARRMLYISRNGGLWVIGLTCFFLSVLALLAIAYAVELAQAVLLMFAPMVLVSYLSLRTALQVETEALADADLVTALMRHRFKVQLIGMVSIFVTAMFGMYQNIL